MFKEPVFKEPHCVLCQNGISAQGQGAAFPIDFLFLFLIQIDNFLNKLRRGFKKFSGTLRPPDHFLKHPPLLQGVMCQ